MKPKLKNLLRGIVISSMATLANSYGAEAMPAYRFSDDSDDTPADEYGQTAKDTNVKMLLHLNSDDTYTLAGHRSHSSHRSHNSHRSHSSHRSGSSHYSHYSSATTSRSTSTSSISPSDYTLGSRTLSLNSYGADVKALTDLLVKHKYIEKASVNTNYLGYVVFDSEVRDAVRSFQKDAGITQDGIAGSSTIAKLQVWIPHNYNLGDRLLKKGMQGTDVTQLKNILIDKEYIDKPFVKGKTDFDIEIERALKRFQDSIGIEATGEVDTQTLYFLKK